MRYALTRTGVFGLSAGTLVLVLFAAIHQFSRYDSLDYSWLRSEDTTWRNQPSRIVNDLPGFMVIDNACYNQKTFCAYHGARAALRLHGLTSRSERGHRGRVGGRHIHQPTHTPIGVTPAARKQEQVPSRLNRCAEHSGVVVCG